MDFDFLSDKGSIIIIVLKNFIPSLILFTLQMKLKAKLPSCPLGILGGIPFYILVVIESFCYLKNRRLTNCYVIFIFWC
jgi:hypothetical protein